MGKKKRQSDPNMENDNDSTESCDENQNATFCPHVAKGVDLTKIKKAVAVGIFSECPECEKNPAPVNSASEDDYQYDLSLWLCLRCGNQACGRSKRKHALGHYNVPRSDCHALCLNTTIWTVWCYECDVMVNSSSKKKLLEAVEWVKRQQNARVSPQKPPIALEYHSISGDSTVPAQSVMSTDSTRPPRVRGLANLGNTCFFNAVMQCLAQTPFLVPTLREMSTPGQPFTLPGGSLILPPFTQTAETSSPTLDTQPPEFPAETPQTQEGKKQELPSLDGQLGSWGPLTEVLCSTLFEMNPSSAQDPSGNFAAHRLDVLNPRPLLSQLTLRQPLFKGGDQHDSHELLRFLLEAVRSEDLRRYHLVILEKLGFSKKTDPSTVEGFTKQIVKFYGQQASDLMIRTDQVFRGVLVSTLQCQECKHSSHRDEFFLDLSLPVSQEKQMPPALRKRAEMEPEPVEKPSKYQLKKEKRAARKSRKHHNNKGNSAAGGPPMSTALNPSTDSTNQESPGDSNPLESGTITEEGPDAPQSDSEESDADVEDNLDDCKSPGGCDDPGKGLESGYNSEKVSDASPELLHALEIDSGLTSPLTVNVPSPQSGQNSGLNSGASSGSSETNIEIPSPQLPVASPEDYERPVSRLAFADKPTLMVEEKPLLEGGDSPRLEPVLGARWGSTLTVSARYQCDDGECSVQSCLNQFTSCELMTGNNKVRCENCTKGGKHVYTNATKQLLISSPPAVLILHLKRFQVFRSFPRKMSKHVTFPLVLDMAPFCSTKCRDLPSIDPQQNRLLFSLYGVVEHSGTIHGGHYVAYVKTRAPIAKESYRWQFLSRPTNTNNNPDENNRVINTSNTNSEDLISGKEKGDADDTMGAVGGDPSAPPGNWYYVSDSYVAEVPESKVLKAQAYLLFYERIL